MKKLRMVLSIALAAVTLGAFAACGPIYDKVDEKDLSRWIVKFTCDYPSDMKEGGVEYSLLALKEMNWNSSDFTITIPYDPEYAEKANADIEFTLEPKTEFYYRKDNGQKVLVDSLNTEKDYYFMRDGLYHFNEDDGKMHNVVRIFRRGEYELDYIFGSDFTPIDTPQNVICCPGIKIVVE